MNVMQGTQSTAAGATTPNIVTGQVFERMPYNGYLRFSFSAEAAGESRVTIVVGGRMAMQESPVSRAARVPVIPDDTLVTVPCRAGEQIFVSHRNTGAGANTLFWRVDIKPAR